MLRLRILLLVLDPPASKDQVSNWTNGCADPTTVGQLLLVRILRGNTPRSGLRSEQKYMVMAESVDMTTVEQARREEEVKQI
ncbi:hypothetical protein Tco_0058358 [Tanacetum coccineum]